MHLSLATTHTERDEMMEEQITLELPCGKSITIEKGYGHDDGYFFITRHHAHKDGTVFSQVICKSHLVGETVAKMVRENSDD